MDPTKQRDRIRQYLGKEYRCVLPDSKNWSSDIRFTVGQNTPGYRLWRHLPKIGIIARQRLDWIFYRGFTFKNEGIDLDATGSDHYFLWAIFQI